MGRQKYLGFLGLLLIASAAQGDIPPEPDRGPTSASVAGLDFAFQSIQVLRPGGFYRSQDVPVLIGCTNGHPNCQVAKSKTLIGMEVYSVDSVELQSQNGKIQQLVDAFTSKTAPKTVTLELFKRGSDGKSVFIPFQRSSAVNP